MGRNKGLPTPGILHNSTTGDFINRYMLYVVGGVFRKGEKEGNRNGS
jgi:hypothetical protein